VARPLLLARRMRTFMLTSIALGSILLGNLACMSEDDLGEDVTLSSPDDEGKADSIEGRKITRVIRRAVYWAGTESVEGDMDVTSDTGTTVKLIGEMSVINLDRAKILELDVESRGFWQWVGRTTMGFQLVAHIGPFKSKDAAWNPTEWRTVECKGDDMETQQEARDTVARVIEANRNAGRAAIAATRETVEQAGGAVRPRVRASDGRGPAPAQRTRKATPVKSES